MKQLRYGLVIILFLLLVLICALITLILLNRYQIIPGDSILFGFDYIPIIWVSILVLPTSLGFLLIKRVKIGLPVLFGYLITLLFWGDISINALLKNERTDKLDGDSFSVLVINVQYYSSGIENVFHAIKSTNVDLALISENILPEDNEVNIDTLIKPYSIYGINNELAILSLYPVKEFNVIQLPSRQTSLSGENDIATLHLNPKRSFVHAVIEINGKLVNLIAIRFVAGRAKNHSIGERLNFGRYLANTHLNEVRFFIDYLDTLKGPIIFGGDLNCPPSSKIIYMLNQIAEDAYLEDHFWGGFTFNTKFPSIRLDYIYYLNNVIPLSSEILDIKVSDHSPIYATFLLPNKESIN